MKIRLRLAQRLFRPLALSDIRRATDELHQVAGSVQNRMANGVDVFHRGARKKNSEFHVVVRLFAHCSVDCFLPLASVLRMNALQSLFESRYAILQVEAIYPIPFVGQVHSISSCYLPDPTPRMREPLCFCQIPLAAPQGFFRTLPLTALCFQRLICAPEFLNCFFQVIARAPERFCGAPLRDAQ